MTTHKPVDCVLIPFRSGSGFGHPVPGPAFYQGGAREFGFTLDDTVADGAKITGLRFRLVDGAAGSSSRGSWDHVDGASDDLTDVTVTTATDRTVAVTPANTSVEARRYEVGVSISEPGKPTIGYAYGQMLIGPNGIYRPMYVVLDVKIDGDDFSFEPPGPWDLHFGNSITVTLNQMPAGTVFRDITFFHNKVVNGVDTKDLNNKVGSLAIGGSGNVGPYQIIWFPPNSVAIVDKEVTNVTDRFWFSLGLTGPNGEDWNPDPELLNQAGKGGITVHT